MFNRAEIIDRNFIKLTKKGKFPKSKTIANLSDLNIQTHDLISIFESQILSRHMDLKARILKDEGKCFYTIGSSGHEGNAVFGKIFHLEDIAFLHYRSTPFFIERSKQSDGSTPLYDTALSFVASSEDQISGGSHKVLGSKKINIKNKKRKIDSNINDINKNNSLKKIFFPNNFCSTTPLLINEEKPTTVSRLKIIKIEKKTINKIA